MPNARVATEVSPMVIRACIRKRKPIPWLAGRDQPHLRQLLEKNQTPAVLADWIVLSCSVMSAVHYRYALRRVCRSRSQ